MGVYRYPVAVNFTGPGAPGVNVFTVRTTSATAPELDIGAAAAALRTFYSAIAGILPTSSSIAFPDEVVSREDQSAVSLSPPAPVTGAGGSDWIDLLQIVVSWRTALRARRGMGRTFIGPLADSVQGSGGTILAGAFDQVRAAAEDLVVASTAASGWSLAVWGQESLIKEGTPEQRALAPHVARDITNFSVKNKIAVLRSRRD